jgi:hypothetical protein
MKLARFIILAIFLAPFARADGGSVNMVFTGVNGANDGQYYVSPYNGTMNGDNVVLFCDDIKNDISVGQHWAANVTNLGTAIATTLTLKTNGFANTRYGGAPGSLVLGNAIQAYEEVAWLTTQFATNPGDFVSLQHAIWDIMVPGSEPLTYGPGSDGYWLNLAGLKYSTNSLNIDPSNFEIVTNVGPVTYTGQEQEFIVQTPEPGTLMLLFCGILALAGFSLLRARAAA